MDEGVNSFNELRYVQTKYPDRKLIGRFGDEAIGKAFDLSRYKQKAQYELSYLIAAKKNMDQPIELPAYDYTELNYGGIVYSKTAIVFDYLKATIGEKEMDKAMQRYFDEWHFKHPMPSDFRKVMEESTGKDLKWFFDDLINSTKKLDYKMASCNKKADGSWDIKVKNKGEINGPLFIQAIKDKKVIAEVSYDGFSSKKALNFPANNVDYFKIDYSEYMPEVNRDNNRIRAKGIFKKVEPLKLQFLGSLDNPDKTQLFFTPVAGWNNYNKWMLGFAFYNNIVPQKKFEFEVMPMLSYSTNDFSGYGRMKYNIFPNSTLFQQISLGIITTRYSYTNHPTDLNNNKVAPEISFEFKKKYARSPYRNTLRYRNISVFRDFYKGNYELNPPVYSRDPIYLNFNDLTYTLTKNHAFTPYSIILDMQQGQGIIKTSLTANYSYNFRKKNKGIDVRFFAGTFIGTNGYDAAPYLFRLSGQRGYQDYLYDNIFLGRSETQGILASQFTETDGGFKFYSTIGQSAKWVTALNIKSSIGNLKLPLKVYADIGTSAKDGLINETVLYNAGVCVSIVKNVFEIYLPILLSKDLQDYKDVNDLKYWETVRFTLNLNLLNPFDIVRSF
jgi:hypothetical protein